MADVLSQREIDALLSAMSSEDKQTQEYQKSNETHYKVYDFKRAMRFSKDQIRGLTRIHDTFARLLTTFLSAQLRTYVQIKIASVDQKPYEEFIHSLPKMTILNSFDVPPLEGRFLMEINPHISYAMMDLLLGGRGASINKVENLTEIETKILKQMMSRTLQTFREAWQSVVDLEIQNKDLEVNPQLLQMISPNETVVVISLDVTIAEATGMMTICLPHVVMEPIIPRLSGRWMQENKKQNRPEGIEQLKDRVQETTVPLKAELGHSDISVQEFLQLDIGDVIELDQSISKPLSLCVGDEAKFMVQPGKKGRWLAVQMIETLDERSEYDEGG